MVVSKETVSGIFSRVVDGKSFFLVGIDISKDNDIFVYVEKFDGEMDISDCVSISRSIEAELDKECDDYSLTVSSAGLDQPFRVAGQYVKYAGKEIDIVTVSGEKIRCLVSRADKDGLDVKYSVLVKEEGKKRKVRKDAERHFQYTEIKSAKPVVHFR